MEYQMGLQAKYFNAIKYGTKKIEMRLNDDKRKQLKIGDTIYFLLEPERKKIIETKIVNLTYYRNFEEAVEKNQVQYLISDDDSKTSYLNDLNYYYSKEDQEKYGVIAIEIEMKEKSCGLIVFKNDTDGLKVLLVHHNTGHWGIPKGHVEDNETEEETAIRETLEETGISAKVTSSFRKVITYKPKENSIKDVVFFIGKPLNNNLIAQETEVQEVNWFLIDDAIEKISHVDTKNLLQEAIDFIKG